MSDLETTRRELDDANSIIRQLLQQRKDLRERAAEAIVSHEQALQRAIALDPTSEHLNGRLSGLQFARTIVTDLPLLPDSDEGTGNPDCPKCEGTNATCDNCRTPHEGAASRLDWQRIYDQGYEDSRRAACQPKEQTRLTSPNHQAQLVAELLGATLDDAAEELDDDPAGTWERAYAAWTNHRRDAATRTNTRYEERLAALEGLTRSIADLVEGHSVDLSQAKAAIRGLARPLTVDTDH